MHLECVIQHIMDGFHLLWKYGFSKRKWTKAGTNDPSGDAVMKTESIHKWLMGSTWISHGSLHRTHSLSCSLFYSQNTEISFKYVFVHASFINPFLGSSRNTCSLRSSQTPRSVNERKIKTELSSTAPAACSFPDCALNWNEPLAVYRRELCMFGMDRCVFVR